MKTKFVLAALAALLAAAPISAHAQPSPTDAASEQGTEINIAIGETKLLSARNVKNYSEGVPGIVEIKLTSDNSQFVINGRRVGTTTLLFIRNDGTQQTYTVNVFARSPAAVDRELRQLLDGLPTVHVRRVGARHILDGYVTDPADKARVDHVASLYPGQVESLVGVGAPAGAPDDEGRKFLVRIDFYFVQLDQSSSYAVGLGWPKSFGGPPSTASFGYDFIAGQATQAAATVTTPIPQLDLASSHGWGKILKHATVITSSGAEAKFQSGGEQNFTVNTGLTVGLQTVPYGVEVGVVPRFDPTRRDLELRLNANVSDLTAPSGGTNVPGRTTSKLTTLVNLRLGQSIVLSGVRTKTQTHTVNGLPLLSEIPVLGVLFGSHQNAESETEGAIYIVPNVIESVPNASMDLIDGAVRKFKDYSGGVGRVDLYGERPRP